MVRRLKSLVLEDENQKPFTIGVADKVKGTIVLILIVVSFAVLFANLYNKAYSIEDNIMHVVWAIVCAGIHVSYLYIVLNLLILGDPIEKLYKQRLTFPIILLFAYLFYALEIWASLSLYVSFSQWEQIFKFTSLVLFILLYVIWMFRDFFEYIENRNIISIIWLIGETLSICSLIFGLCNKEYEWIASQNTPVIICLFIYVSYKFIYEHIQEQERYKDIYDKYLQYNSTRSNISIKLDIDKNNHGFNILDFGCGDGSRLLQNLLWIHEFPLENSTIVGFDKRKSFRSKFEQRMESSKAKSVSFVSDINKLEPEVYNLIIISHVLYEQDVFNTLFAILNRCKNGTIIFFRGASPSSFFVSMSFAGSNTLSMFSRKKNRCHLWYSIWLDEISTLVHLKRFNESIESYKPDYIIKQDYEISNKEAVEYIGILLRKLYTGTFVRRSEDYFNALQKYSGVKTISNDDLIYIYIKCNA